MLGIGFIITHFDAMQKPQQRKYHSSCNRSVHRGTAHGKQEVKVCKRKTPHLFLMRSFLSPYGDGTHYCTLTLYKAEFSPPYGDGTAECSVKFTGNQVFAPLRGWYIKQNFKPTMDLVFAPLRGWYREARHGLCAGPVFAPLRG